MPANLTPQFQKAEEAYRRAHAPEEQVACLEEMLKLIPKHKGTEKLQADLKTRLKEARAELEAEKKAPPKGGRVPRIPRQGAGQVVVLGGPNAGKSRLVGELSGAKTNVAPFPFATREALAGMMRYEDVQIQLIDTPPLTSSQVDPVTVSMARSADLCLFCMDGSSDDAPEQTIEAADQLREWKTFPAATSGFADDDFSQVLIRTFLVVTRADDPGVVDRIEFLRELDRAAAPSLAELETILVELDRLEAKSLLPGRIYRALGVVRIYTKAPGKPADRTAPFTLAAGATVADLAAKVHRDLASKVKFARRWAAGAADVQTIGPDAELAEGDLVELHT